MPWKETSSVTERMSFIVDYLKKEHSVAELCRHYGMPQKTGYKWIARWNESCGDPTSLLDRSRAPRSCPHAMSSAMGRMIMDARRQHPRWGPLKLLAVLRERHPKVEKWPAPSSVGALLKRHGLALPRKPRPKATPSSMPFGSCDHPGDTWAMDFKGQWQVSDGRMCYPLTVSDLATRYLIRVQALENQRTAPVEAILVGAFREHGLPLRIRSDNGPPFATTTLAGLSRLSVKLMLLGIEHERIVPGRPQQNGSHERMHRTLKQEVTARPQARSLIAQQRDFDEIVQEFNYVRPHQALGLIPPARLYVPSARPYPEILPTPEYPGAQWVVNVAECGEFRWRGSKIYLSKALGGQPVGLVADPADERYLQIWFCQTPIGRLEIKTKQVRQAVEMPS